MVGLDKKLSNNPERYLGTWPMSNEALEGMFGLQISGGLGRTSKIIEIKISSLQVFSYQQLLQLDSFQMWACEYNNIQLCMPKPEKPQLFALSGQIKQVYSLRVPALAIWNISSIDLMHWRHKGSRLHNNDARLVSRSAHVLCWQCALALSLSVGRASPAAWQCRGCPPGCMLGDDARGSASFDPQCRWAPFCDVICIWSIIINVHTCHSSLHFVSSVLTCHT